MKIMEGEFEKIRFLCDFNYESSLRKFTTGNQRIDRLKQPIKKFLSCRKCREKKPKKLNGTY